MTEVSSPSANFGVTFPEHYVSPKQMSIIERKRALEEERRLRILDPKRRTIGVDLKALEQQVEEKSLRNLAAKEDTKLYHLDNLSCLLILL